MTFFKVVTISLVFSKNFLLAYKCVGAGLALVSMSGTSIGIGIIFAAFILAYAYNPLHEGVLFNYVVIGFALTEAIALFGIMFALLILFG